MSGLKILTREEVKKEYTWSIEDLFATDEQWEQEYIQAGEECGKMVQFQGKLGQSSDVLLAALEQESAISKIFERVYVYASQRLHENMANSKYQDMFAKAQNLAVRVSGATAFIRPEILEIDEDRLKGFLAENSGLKLYELMISRFLREKEHTLSKKEEELLAKTSEISEIPSDVFDMFNNADASFGILKDEEGNEIELTHGRYGKLLESRNRQVRENAFKTLYKEYISHKNTLAALYMGNVKQMKFYADVRKYESSRQMELSKNEIPEIVYDNLIEAVHEYLPVLHKYMKIRKKALGVDELHMYDLYVPITKEFEMKVPFEEAVRIVKEALAPMGQDYLSHFQEGIDNRWIDIYENQGKKSGAYSWGAYGTHPYVLLNYQDNLNNVFTLAHEMGHALHSYYSDATQPYPYAEYRLFVAEVASTCNESLLIHHLLGKCKDKEERIYLLNYFIDQFKGTILRQTMFAEFEKITHGMVGAGQGLNADNLCEIYYNLNKQYYGDGVVSDEEIAMEWSRIPHFYSPFYVYQYATGFSAAIALSKRIMSLGKTGVDDYMKFLTGGSSATPIELLQKAGVDMNTSKPVRDALELFKSLVDELEQLI